MIPSASSKDFDAWARHRLAEMDAGLAAMDAEMATARATVIAVSHAAMEQARAWRDRFARCVAVADFGEASHIKDTHLKDIAPALREAWVHFETEMENWAVASEQKNIAFDARARALLGVWHAAAAGYKAQALAAADPHRAQLQAAIEKLEREAMLYAEKFEALHDAGKLSWVAMGETLKESRAAFERASAAAEAVLATARKPQA